MQQTVSSVAESLRRAHAALLKDLRRLEAMVQPAIIEKLPDLRARLEATRANLTEHFRFEEQNGYMEMARHYEPRLERAIQQLAREHREIARSLGTLIGEAKEATTLSDRLRGGIRRWIECVRQHEERENELIQNVFNLDVGPED